MTDPTPAATARDALALALHEAKWQPAMDGKSLAKCLFARESFAHKMDHDAQADAILAALPDGRTLAAAEAPGRVAGEVEAACSDRGCLHYDDEEPPCVGHMPSICCAKLSASIGAAAVADYRDVTPALTAAALAEAMRATGGQVFEGGEAVPAAFYLPWAEAILAAPAPTQREDPSACTCGAYDVMDRLHDALAPFTPGARDE